ncbi:MAG: hypothetical protein V8S58_02225 [Lachnospiraceae bacterium]
MKETVIVTAIGSFSAQNVISACHAAGMRVVGCDIYPAEWVVNSQDVDVFYKAPYATDREQYRNFIKELCRKEQASVLMPLTDVEIDVIQQWRTEVAEDFKERWAQRSGFPIVSAFSLCRKREDGSVVTGAEALPDHSGSTACRAEGETGQDGVRTCRMRFWQQTQQPVEETSMDFSDLRYPLVAKPFDGRSSQGLRILESKEDLEFLLHTCSEEQKQQYLVQPKIGGHVITVDVVRNPESGQVFCLPRGNFCVP